MTAQYTPMRMTRCAAFPTPSATTARASSLSSRSFTKPRSVFSCRARAASCSTPPSRCLSVQPSDIVRAEANSTAAENSPQPHRRVRIMPLPAPMTSALPAHAVRCGRPRAHATVRRWRHRLQDPGNGRREARETDQNCQRETERADEMHRPLAGAENHRADRPSTSAERYRRQNAHDATRQSRERHTMPGKRSPGTPLPATSHSSWRLEFPDRSTHISDVRCRALAIHRSHMIRMDRQSVAKLETLRLCVS